MKTYFMKSSLLQVIRKNTFNLLVILLYILFVHFISSKAITRVYTFNANYWDLGIRQQVLTNTIHGNILEYTHQYTQQNINYLGIHFEPIILIYALVFFLAPTPYMIVVLQAVFVGTSIFFAFKLAKILLKNELLAFLCAVFFALNPNLHTVLLFDMHGITLAIPILLYIFILIEQKKYNYLLLPILLLLCTKEHIGFTVSSLGIYLIFVKKQYYYGIFYTIFGAIMPFFLVYFVMPNFANVSHEHLSMYSGMTLKSMYTVLTNTRTLDYLTELIAFSSPLILLSPQTLLIAIPELAINIFGKYSMQTLYYHYAAVIIPIFFYSMVKVLAFISKQSYKTTLVILGYSLFLLIPVYVTLTRHYSNPDAQQIHNEINIIKNLYPDITNYDTVIATSYFLGPHFSGRKVFYDTFNELDIAADNYEIENDISTKYNNAKYIIILTTDVSQSDQNIVVYKNIVDDPNYQYIPGFERISLFVRRSI